MNAPLESQISGDGGNRTRAPFPPSSVPEKQHGCRVNAAAAERPPEPMQAPCVKCSRPTEIPVGALRAGRSARPICDDCARAMDQDRYETAIRRQLRATGEPQEAA